MFTIYILAGLRVLKSKSHQLFSISSSKTQSVVLFEENPPYDRWSEQIAAKIRRQWPGFHFSFGLLQFAFDITRQFRLPFRVECTNSKII